MVNTNALYQSGRCWQCVSYPRELFEQLPPPEDERRYCPVTGKTRSAYSLVCINGRRDQERYREAIRRVTEASSGNVPAGSEETTRPSPARTRPELSSYPASVQTCVAVTKPDSAYYVRVSKTDLTSEELEQLVSDGYLLRYARKPYGFIYRLAGKYHYLVQKD